MGRDRAVYEECIPLCGDKVDCEAEGSPEGHHDGEHTKPNGDDWDDDEGGRGDGSDNVGPHSRNKHHLHEETQPLLRKWAVLLVEDDLEVTLQKARMSICRMPLQTEQASQTLEVVAS